MTQSSISQLFSFSVSDKDASIVPLFYAVSYHLRSDAEAVSFMAMDTSESFLPQTEAAELVLQCPLHAASVMSNCVHVLSPSLEGTSSLLASVLMMRDPCDWRTLGRGTRSLTI